MFGLSVSQHVAAVHRSNQNERTHPNGGATLGACGDAPTRDLDVLVPGSGVGCERWVRSVFLVLCRFFVETHEVSTYVVTILRERSLTP